MAKYEGMPDIFIVGTQKSGTTVLFDWLAQHPQIFGNPAAKDFPFFCDDDIYNNGTDKFIAKHKGKSVDQLLLGGDANIMYESNALERLRKTLPNVKLIVILRDPVMRCFSAWRYAAERGLEYRTFSNAILDEMEGKHYSSPWEHRQKDYLEHGKYAGQIEKLYDLFDKGKICIVFYEDLRNQPEELLKQLYRFVGVDTAFEAELTKKNVTKGGSRFSWLSYILYRQRPQKNFIWRLLRILVPENARTALRERLVSFNRQATPALEFSNEMRAQLREYYTEDIVRLEKMLKRDFATWHD